MGRARGWPRKQVVTTLPTSVRVFSSYSATQGTGIKASTTVSTLSGEKLETIIEEEKADKEGTKADQAQPWVDFIQGYRLFTHGLDIEYTIPSIVNGEIEVVIED